MMPLIVRDSNLIWRYVNFRPLNNVEVDRPPMCSIFIGACLLLLEPNGEAYLQNIERASFSGIFVIC